VNATNKQRGTSAVVDQLTLAASHCRRARWLPRLAAAARGWRRAPARGACETTTAGVRTEGRAAAPCSCRD
jgi:hypothetical protein